MTILNHAIGETLGTLSEVLGTPFPTDTQSPTPPPPPGPPTSLLPGIIPGMSTPLYPAQLPPDLPQAPLWVPPQSPISPPVIPMNHTTPLTPSPPDSGAAADALKSIQEAQRQASTEISKASDKLSEVMLQANSDSEQGKARLRALQQQITDEITKLGPQPWSPATEAQMAEYMQGKVSDIKDVLDKGDLDSKSHAAVMDALDAEFKASNTKPNPSPTGGNGTGSGTGTNTGSGTGSGTGSSPADSGSTSPDDGLNGLGNGDTLPNLMGQAIPALSQIPQELAGIPSNLGSGFGGLIPGGLGSMGGLSDLRDPESGEHGHHGDDPGDKPDPLKDPSAADNPPSGTPDAKPDPLKDPSAAAAADPGATPTAAAPAAAVDPKAATSVTLPNSTETRQASSPELAQAVRDVIKGDDVDTAFHRANLDLPPVGQLGNTPVDPAKIALGTIGQFTDHRVVAMSNHDVLVNGQVVPLEQLQTGPNFLGWVNATGHAAASAPPVPASTNPTVTLAQPAPQVS